MIYGNILEATGQTPLIRLNHMTGPQDAQILVKFEAMNAGGSIKTRTALAMIETAEKQGRIRPGENTIVEPTSGNQGIGLALIGAVKGYRTIIIMPGLCQRGEKEDCEALRGGSEADPRRGQHRQVH